MMALVWTIIGIGLVAAMLVSGSSLLNPSTMNMVHMKDNAVSSFQGMASAYHAYVNANDIPPTTADWQTQLVPGYLPELKTPIPDMTWSYDYDATYGYYFCLSGTINQVAYTALVAIEPNLPLNSYFVAGNACAARSTILLFGGFPRAIYATYWLRGS